MDISHQKPRYFLTAIIAFVAIVVFTIFSFSSLGQELHADMWFMLVMMLYMVVFYWYTTKKGWTNFNKSQKIRWGLGSIFLTIILIGAINFFWPLLPPGRASAMKFANEFMSDLKNQNYASAVDKLSPVTKQHVGVEAFDSPDARPISWNLTKIDGHSTVTGSAIFPDKVELPVRINMRWIDNHWAIAGAEFGEWKKDEKGNIQMTTRVSFLMCCDSYGPVFDWLFDLILK